MSVLYLSYDYYRTTMYYQCNMKRILDYEYTWGWGTEHGMEGGGVTIGGLSQYEYRDL